MKQRDYNLIEKYQQLYGAADFSDEISQIQKGIKKKYILACILFFCVIVFHYYSEQDIQKKVIKDEKGAVVSVNRPLAGNEPFQFIISAEIMTGQGIMEKDFQITIEPYDSREMSEESEDNIADLQSERPYSEQIEQQIEQSLDELNQNTKTQSIHLPLKTDNGETICWKLKRNSNAPLYILLFLFSLYLIHRTRYDKVKAKEQAAKRSIIKELPEFTNKLILLLNAGVVLNTAFVKIMEDRGITQKEDSYFYQQLGNIYKSMTSANGALQEEFRGFARRSGVRELMRVANIINDNIKKGTDLTEKLQRENEILWFSRKQQAEEHAKLAETKLTMPLMILLSVLVLVTIAPAMMDM